MITSEGRETACRGSRPRRGARRAVAVPPAFLWLPGCPRAMRCPSWPTRCCARTGRWVSGRAVAGRGQRRGHGALYDALDHGRLDVGAAAAVAGGPAAAAGRGCAAGAGGGRRTGCGPAPRARGAALLPRARPRAGQAQLIPGWPYSVVAALEPGRTSWAAVLDAVRLGPDDDDTALPPRRSARSSPG